MSDRLDWIEEHISSPLVGWTELENRDVIALVEVARAAREWDADLSDACDGPIRDRLRAALARLEEAGR